MTRFRRRDAERRDDLVLLAAGMLEDRERDELLAHLATGCPECTADLASAGSTLEKLAAVLRPSPPPAHVKAALMARVRAEPRETIDDESARRATSTAPRANGSTAGGANGGVAGTRSARPDSSADDGEDAASSRGAEHSVREHELLARALAAARSAGEAGSPRSLRSSREDEVLASAIAAAHGAPVRDRERPPIVLPLLTAVAAAVVAAGMTWFGMRNRYDDAIGRLEDDVASLRVSTRHVASDPAAVPVDSGSLSRPDGPGEVESAPSSGPGPTPQAVESSSPLRGTEATAAGRGLEGELAAAHRAATAAELRAEKAERELAALREDQTRVAAANAGLVGEVASAKAEAEALRKSNAELEEQVASLEHESATRASDGSRERQLLQDHVAVLRAKLDQAGMATALLSSPAVEAATLDAAKDAPDGATANVFWDAERGTCYLHATGLAPTTGDEVYTLWLATDADRTYPMGSFQVGENGEGTLLAMLPAGKESIERATVTREPGTPGTEATGPAVLDARFGKSGNAGSRRRPFHRDH